MAMPIAVIGSPTTSHGGFFSIPAHMGCPNVQSGGLPMVRMGDYWGEHCDGESCHVEIAMSIFPNVQCMSQPISCVGTPTSLGDFEAAGFPLVGIG